MVNGQNSASMKIIEDINYNSENKRHTTTSVLSSFVGHKLNIYFLSLILRCSSYWWKNGVCVPMKPFCFFLPFIFSLKMKVKTLVWEIQCMCLCHCCFCFSHCSGVKVFCSKACISFSSVARQVFTILEKNTQKHMHGNLFIFHK